MAPEKREDDVVEVLGLLEVHEMPGAFHHGELGARDAPRDVARHGKRVDAVFAPRDYERGRADLFERRGAILRDGGLKRLEIWLFAHGGDACHEVLESSGARLAAKQALQGLVRRIPAVCDEFLDLLGRERVESRARARERERLYPYGMTEREVARDS